MDPIKHLEILTKVLMDLLRVGDQIDPEVVKVVRGAKVVKGAKVARIVKEEEIHLGTNLLKKGEI